MYYFLDVDGVLNRECDWKRSFTLCDECVSCLAKLLGRDKDPHIILSSTWRAGYTNTGSTGNGGDVLTEKLLEYGLHIEGSTPVSAKSRQEEIEYYIRRHDISAYLVLDDDPSLFPWPDRINLYLTDYRKGLTMQDVKRLHRRIK